MSPSSPLFPFFPAIFRIFLFLFPLFFQHAMRVTPNYGGFLLLFPHIMHKKIIPFTYIREKEGGGEIAHHALPPLIFFPHDIRQADLGRLGAQITNRLLHPPPLLCGKLVLRPQRFKKSPLFDIADSKGAHPTLIPLGF